MFTENRIDAEYYSMEIDPRFQENFSSDFSTADFLAGCKERTNGGMAYAIGTEEIVAFVRPGTKDDSGETVLVTDGIKSADMKTQSIYKAWRRGEYHDDLSDSFYKNNGYNSHSVLNKIFQKLAIEKKIIDFLAVCKMGNDKTVLSLYRRTWEGKYPVKSYMQKAFGMDERIKQMTEQD